MTKIGSFRKVEIGFVGEIITLSVQNRDVRIVPEAFNNEEGAPTHKVLVGSAHIGSAWLKKAVNETEYLTVELDDPSFVGPITAELRANDQGNYVLIWNRPR